MGWIALIVAALLVLALHSADSAEPATLAAAPEEPSGSPATEVESYAADYEAFLAPLAAFLDGEDEVLPELRRAAARFAERHGRADAPRVVDYYAELSASERRRGLDARDEVDAFHERSYGKDGRTWRETRAALLADLDRFIARAMAQPDFVPAANALALRAELRVEWSEASVSSDEEPLEERIASATRDAREALAVYDRAGMWTPRLRPLMLLGRLARLQGDALLARARFEECLELAERCRVDGYREETLLALVRMARDAGDVPRLNAHLAELASFRSPAECWPLAREHAMRLVQADEAARAAEFLVRHRPQDPGDVDAWRHTLAIARVRLGDHDAARALIERTRGALRDEDARLLYATLDLEVRDTAAVLDGLMDANGALPSFSPRGRSLAAALVGEAHLLEGRPSDALHYLELARTLAESQEARLAEESPRETTGATVIGEWLGLHAVALEARALAALERPLDAAVLIERAHGWRWSGSARSDRLGAANGSLDAADLVAWAAHFEHGLVTWILGADGGLAVHVLPDGRAYARRVEPGRRSLERAVRRLRSALLTDEAPERVEALSESLIRELFPESLRLHESSRSPGRALLLAHGALERLPFEALRVDGAPLDELAALVVLPELPARRPGEAAQEELSWSLCGDPVDALGRRRLPAAGEELDDLGRLLPDAVRQDGEAFDRAAVLDALASGRALHLATHVAHAERCADERFADIALELSGGELLCAAELAMANGAAPLVVLAACESAEGRSLDARGLQGLARALLDGGTRNLVVTLWPIRDDVARDFSPHFHAALLRGERPSEAVRSARRALADAGLPAADWAAFRALGRD